MQNKIITCTREKTLHNVPIIDLSQFSLYDNFPSGIGLTTIDGEILRANKYMSQLTGYTKEELTKIHAANMYYNQKDREIILKQFKKYGHINNYEIKLKHKDGGFHYISFNMSQAILTTGQKILLTISNDITDRKKTEKMILLHSEIMKNMSEGVYLISLKDGLIVYTNPKFEFMFGYEPGEMIGKSVAIVNAPTDKTPEETKKEIIEILKKTGEWHGEIQNIKKDGTPFWCYAGCSLFDHPEYNYIIVAVHTDITDRKKAEEKLNASQVMFKNIYDGSPIAIELYDSKGNLLNVNKSCLDLFGVSNESEVTGFKLFEDPNISDEYKACLLKGETVRYEAPFDFDKVIKHNLYKTNKHGIIYIDVLITPLFGNDKNIPINYLVHVQDITDRKKAEEKLQKLNDLLLEKTEDLEQIISIVIHDIRTQVGSCSMYIDLLKNDESDKEGMINISSLDLLKSSAQSTVETLETLRAWSKEGRGTIKTGTVDVAEIISSIKKEYKKLFILDENVITYDMEMPKCKAEYNLLRHHIFKNLINNAIKFQNPDRQFRIHISGEVYKEDKNVVVYCIEDNGIGIEKNNLEEIFKFNYQILDPSAQIKTENAGQGIGLSIVKKIVRLLGGDVWADSEYGKWTKIYISLPIP
ncbi:PAS domain S-box protein [Candidatus Margulisiibacteriota bacterium]